MSIHFCGASEHIQAESDIPVANSPVPAGKLEFTMVLLDEGLPL